MKFNLDDKLEKKIRGKGFNPGFISFLVYYFLGESEEIERVPSKLSTDEAFRKRVKRAFKKAEEPDKWMRSALKKPGRKAFPPLARKNKYGYDLINESRRGRPRNRNFWALIHCLKTYLKEWQLIIEILYEIQGEKGESLHKWDEDSLRSEWSRQKEKFHDLNAEGIIENLLSTYKYFYNDSNTIK